MCKIQYLVNLYWVSKYVTHDLDKSLVYVYVEYLHMIWIEYLIMSRIEYPMTWIKHPFVFRVEYQLKQHMYMQEMFQVILCMALYLFNQPILLKPSFRHIYLHCLNYLNSSCHGNNPNIQTKMFGFS